MKQLLKRLNPFCDPYESCGPEEYVHEMRQRDSELRTFILSLFSLLIAFAALIVSILK